MTIQVMNEAEFTSIDFYTDIKRVLYASCHLARSLYREGKKLVIVGNAAQLQELDRLLWTFSQLDFIPHCFAHHPLAGMTPIVLAQNLEAPLPHYEYLLNLKPEAPVQFRCFQHVLEMVSDNNEDIMAGRERYRFYRAQEDCKLRHFSFEEVTG